MSLLLLKWNSAIALPIAVLFVVAAAPAQRQQPKLDRIYVTRGPSHLLRDLRAEIRAVIQDSDAEYLEDLYKEIIRDLQDDDFADDDDQITWADVEDAMDEAGTSAEKVLWDSLLAAYNRGLLLEAQGRQDGRRARASTAGDIFTRNVCNTTANHNRQSRGSC